MGTVGPVTVVTGAAGGIGHALAVRLHDLGHRLCLTDVDAEALEEACARSGLRTSDRVAQQTLDVRDPDRWRACFDGVIERHGRLDVLFNIAGYMRSKSLLDSEDIDVEMHFDINAKGMTYGTRIAASHMVRQRSGHIVNLASLMGIAPVPGFSLYSASKHAARGMSLCAAQELRPMGVFVTAVCPDAVDTGMLGAQLDTKSAAIAFSGPRPLRVAEVVDVLTGHVLEKRPIEVTLAPPRTARAALSKLVAAMPALTVPMGPIVTAIGERAQRKAKRRQQS